MGPVVQSVMAITAQAYVVFAIKGKPIGWGEEQKSPAVILALVLRPARLED